MRELSKNDRKKAVEQAHSFPLTDNSIQHAEKLLFTITGGDDLTMHEIVDIASLILDTTDTEAQIKFGVEIDEKMQGKVKVTIIAAGIRDTDAPSTISPTKRTTVSPDRLDIPAFMRITVREG